jgi:phage tail sheath protein FI
MAVKFDFLSPGVNIREIDNSVLPAEAIAAGPILIGRTRRGPAMQPIRVRSYEDFVDVFGAPVLGSAGSNTDIWRDGNLMGPQYAALAAQAHLASDTTPITFVRLLGDDSDVSPVSSTKPGWALAKSPNADPAENSTAYGLFLINSGAAGPSGDAGAGTDNSGALAAVFYVNSGFMTLSGTMAEPNTITSSAGTLIKSQGDSKEFKAVLYNSSATKLEEVSFNFDDSDNSKYIRSQFNTNPIMNNADLVTDTKNYWLGETFDRFVADNVSNSDAGEVYGILLPLESGSYNWSDHQEAHSAAQSGWVIAQDQGAALDFNPAASNQKLFRMISIHGGSDIQKQTMVAISNITLPVDNAINPFASFNVEVLDLAGAVLEEFRGVNLDPQSSNYIVKRIGNTSYTWVESEKRYTSLGDELNQSNYFRVEVGPIVSDGGAQGLMPFGFLGPVRPKGFSIVDQDQQAKEYGGTNLSGSDGDFLGVFAKGNNNMPYSGGGGAQGIFARVPLSYTGSFRFPQIALRAAGGDGNPVDEYEVYYGIRPKVTSTSTRTDSGYVDYVRKLNLGTDSFSPGGDYEYSFIFSMDDLLVNSTTRTVTYTSGSRVAGTSRTATSGAADLITTLGIQQFVMPVWGGFDGLDVTEKEPFRNTVTANGTVSDNFAVYSIFKAVDSIRNSEQVIANSLSMPGATTNTITNKIISMCEDRKDLLGIIDLADGYVPSPEGSSNPTVGSVTSVISSAKTRKLNSSYACTYYPWVQISANTGVDSGKLWAPPSVAAIGAFASSQRQSELWFAPAGFTRGGLAPLGGSGGPSVVNVDGTLTAKERDKLYQININPIASFPGEGIVIFGQKTLQAIPSALDRINVRRLLIYLKGELSRISRSLLFEPNVTATWLSFKTQADQVLSNVKANFGVTEYKIVLDETTTTADLIDRNILYAKVFIKPTRAIEYIVVDLIVTNTGAEFV